MGEDASNGGVGFESGTGKGYVGAVDMVVVEGALWGSVVGDLLH